MIPVEFYLVLSTLLFFIGVFGFIARKNLVGVLMSIELILNAVNINLVAFNRYLFPGQMDGYIFSLFVIVVAAAETAVAMAIILNVYRHKGNETVNSINDLKN